MMNTQRPAGSSLYTTIKARYPWLMIGLVLIGATFLFTFRIGSEGLWIDELFSIRDASAYNNPFGVYQASRIRPLYYMALNVWMQFGSSYVWLRLLSVVFAIISVYLIYRLGRRIVGETEGLIAAVLLATSPLFINHAQEVRMYVLSLCMGLAGTLFLVEALLTERSQKPSNKTIGGWAIFRLLAMLSVPLNITLLIPDAIFILLRFRKEPGVLLSFAKWSLLLVAGWLPAIPPILSDVSPSSEYAQNRTLYAQRPGLNNLIHPLKYWMIPPQVVYLGKPVDLFYKLFTLLVGGLVGAGLLQKHKTPASSWMIGWVILPIIPIIAFSLISAVLWEPRYVLFVCPYLFILMAAGFTRLWRQWKPAAVAAIIVYTLAIGLATGYYYVAQNRPDYRFNIETVEQLEQPGDGIVWGYNWDDPLTYYYDGDNPTYWLSMFNVETDESLQEWMAQLPTNHERLWIVIERPQKSARGKFEAAIKETYNVEKTIEFSRRSKVMLITDANKALPPADLTPAPKLSSP